MPFEPRDLSYTKFLYITRRSADFSDIRESRISRADIRIFLIYENAPALRHIQNRHPSTFLPLSCISEAERKHRTSTIAPCAQTLLLLRPWRVFGTCKWRDQVSAHTNISGGADTRGKNVEGGQNLVWPHAPEQFKRNAKKTIYDDNITLSESGRAINLISLLYPCGIRT